MATNEPKQVPFPISRDPPEGGTVKCFGFLAETLPEEFPISRDPPEGGTHIEELYLIIT